MLERSRIWVTGMPGLATVLAIAMQALAGCAATETAQPEQPAVVAVAQPAVRKPDADSRAIAEEARALLAQAETDIQRARARRSLWAKAWEALVGARASFAANDNATAIRQAKRASELAQLGLEQLAYPAVMLQATPAGERANLPSRSSP